MIKFAFCFLDYYKSYDADYTSISEVAGTYTMLLSDTTYLKIGDTILLDSNEYTVTALTSNTSIEFTATTGLTFSNDFITWYPFYKVALGKKEPIYFNGMI